MSRVLGRYCSASRWPVELAIAATLISGRLRSEGLEARASSDERVRMERPDYM